MLLVVVRSVTMTVWRVVEAGAPGTLSDSLEECGSGDGAGVGANVGPGVGTGTGKRGGSGVGWGNTWEVERLGVPAGVCGGGVEVSEVDELSEDVLSSFFGFLSFPLPRGGPELSVSSSFSSSSGASSSLLSTGSRGTRGRTELLRECRRLIVVGGYLRDLWVERFKSPEIDCSHDIHLINGSKKNCSSVVGILKD